MNPNVKLRRECALVRLEETLEKKEKTQKKTQEKVPLTPKDTKRISAEIKTLKSRIQ